MELGVSDKTVTTQREELEIRSEIPNVEHIIATKGRNHLTVFGQEADGREIQTNVCSILKSDTQTFYVKGDYRPKAKVQCIEFQ